MSVVELEKNESVAVLWVDNPPVNSISQAVRQELMLRLSEAVADDEVAALILAARGRTFMAGADITEFDAGPKPPLLTEVVEALEAAPKPVIAALHGFALGGGLELALGCHYRLAAPGTRLGFPEVNLGIIPGATGTQRAPRLIGARAALDLITTARQIGAEEAKELGLIDRLAKGDLIADAQAFAGEIIESGAAVRRISEMAVDPATVPDGLFDETRQKLAKKRRGFEAPQVAVTAVEAAVTLPYGEGVLRERELVRERRVSAQSKALRHLFFAERECARIPGLPKETATRDIERVAIIGAGTMGGGIAMAFADSGFPVTLLEINQDALGAGLERIAKTYSASVARGRLTDAEAEARRGRITGTTSYDDLAGADLVIEAVFEKMEVKKQVFEALDKVARPGAILASNTSYLDLDEIAAATGRPGDVIGLHFFSPANVMKLLEIVRGARTAPEVLATATRLAKRIGKVGVVAGVCLGFIGNRMLQGYAREAGLLLLEGASPSDVDAALYGFGMAMGPFAVADLAGIDIGYMLRQSLDPAQYEAKAFVVHNRLVEMGRKGQKTGAGFYRYEEGNRTPQPDPEVETLIAEEAAKLGIERRAIEAPEIVDRCILALVNEGARILDEGIAYRAGDIDVVYVNGYGFPRTRGGPMHYADHLGLAEVLKTIEGFAQRFGPRWWTPAPLLQRLAAEGSTFGASPPRA